MTEEGRGNFVLDNSVTMTWALQDESSEYANRVLKSLKDSKAFVPHIWPLEVVNVLQAAERTKRIREADSVRFLTLLASLPIQVVPTDQISSMRDLLTTSRKFGLTSYDASYLELAISQNLPIATLDKAIRRAVRKEKLDFWLA